MTIRAILGAMTMAALSAGCGPVAPPKAPDAVVQRAAFDLSCSTDQLSFIPLAKSSPRSFGVTGCHKRVAYVEICSIAMYGMITNKSCQWTMDGPIQTDVPAPPPVLPGAAPMPPASSGTVTPN